MDNPGDIIVLLILFSSLLVIFIWIVAVMVVEMLIDLRERWELSRITREQMRKKK